MRIITAWQRISPEVTVRAFKKFCIASVVDGTVMICFGMIVKRTGMFVVSVRKMKAQTVKMGTVTLIGKDR